MSLKNRQLLQFCFGCSGCGIRTHKFLWFKSSDVLPERGIKSTKEEKVIKQMFSVLGTKPRASFFLIKWYTNEPNYIKIPLHIISMPYTKHIQILECLILFIFLLSIVKGSVELNVTEIL